MRPKKGEASAPTELAAGRLALIRKAMRKCDMTVGELIEKTGIAYTALRSLLDTRSEFVRTGGDGTGRSPYRYRLKDQK